MAPLTGALGTAATPRGRTRVRTGFRIGRPGRIGVVALVSAYFLIPILCTLRYALEGGGRSFSFTYFTQVLTDPTLVGPLETSLAIAGGTIVLTLGILVPTSIWVNLRLPHLRRVMESVTLLPLVVPAVVLVLGIFGTFKSFPNFIIGTPVILSLEYVILALPYSYRAIDSGVQAMDIHVLVDAGRSLGATWTRLFLHVLLPGLRSALLSAAFLTVAFVLGEFAVANLMSFSTFPTWLYQIGTEQAGEAIATSVLALLLVWGILAVISFAGGGRVPRHTRTKDGE